MHVHALGLFRFNAKDAKVLIDGRILVVKNPRTADVAERIDLERRINELDVPSR